MTPKNSAKILLIDDQDNWRALLKKALRDEDIHVLEASNIQQAKKMLMQSNFDLVVFDVRLKDEDSHNVEGLGLLYFAKEHSPQTKTIILTGYPESVRGEIDADAFLFKVPEGTNFSKDAFRLKVLELLN